MSDSPASASQVVFITGATTGIGRATALYLARRGYHVIASGRKPDLLASLAAEAQAAGGRLDTTLLDVTSATSITAATAEIDRLTAGHGVDVLVNNAGYGVVGPLAELDDAALRAQFDTNVFGLMAVTRALLPRMIERRAGRVINLSSVGGKISFPLMGAYTATKFAVEAMSDALRVELHAFGVRVVLIEPGAIRTEFSDRAMSTTPHLATSRYAGALRRADAVRARMETGAGHPDDIARAIHRAIRSRRPAARYVAPFVNRVLLGAHRVLPTRAWDWVIRRLSFLTPQHLDAAVAPAELPSAT